MSGRRLGPTITAPCRLPRRAPAAAAAASIPPVHGWYDLWSAKKLADGEVTCKKQPGGGWAAVVSVPVRDATKEMICGQIRRQFHHLFGCATSKVERSGLGGLLRVDDPADGPAAAAAAALLARGRGSAFPCRYAAMAAKD